MMRLEVWPSELAFGVDSWDSTGKVLEYKVYDWCNLRFKMGHNTDYLYTNAKSWGNGDAKAKNQAVFMNSKHMVRGGNKQCGLITIWRNRVGV